MMDITASTVATMPTPMTTHAQPRATARSASYSSNSTCWNGLLPCATSDSYPADAAARAERALDAVGLSHRKNYLPSELSGGEQQRVAIARALINDPPLVLADEATGNLDTASGAEVLEIFRRIVNAGRTLVLITHDREVAGKADRILSFDDGRIAGEERIRARSSEPPSGVAGAA
jgi:putative ABC transport system ATP-binding protein